MTSPTTTATRALERLASSPATTAEIAKATGLRVQGARRLMRRLEALGVVVASSEDARGRGGERLVWTAKPVR